MYAHAYNCTLADKNGGPIRGKPVGKTQHLKQCPRSTEAVGIAVWPPHSLGLQISWNRQTHTQTNYSDPRCACAPRVNDVKVTLSFIYMLVQEQDTGKDS